MERLVGLAGLETSSIVPTSDVCILPILDVPIFPILDLLIFPLFDVPILQAVAATRMWSYLKTRMLPGGRCPSAPPARADERRAGYPFPGAFDFNCEFF